MPEFRLRWVGVRNEVSLRLGSNNEVSLRFESNTAGPQPNLLEQCSRGWFRRSIELGAQNVDTDLIVAERCGSFYVTERWLGGTLTNFQTMKKQIKRLKDLEQGAAEGDFENYTKKEQLLFDRERGKLDKNLSGIKNMTRLPGALFIVDAKKERIAVAEANKLGIPVVAMVDTNADPDLITVPIPGNDDAIRAVALISGAIGDVISEARRQQPMRDAGEDGEGVTYSTETGVEADADGDRKKKPARRKRRPKPEAIAARLKTEDTPAAGEPVAGGES